jgi:hypothetical protein
MDCTHRLPITRQAQLLGLSRSSVYSRAVPPTDLDLRTMRPVRQRDSETKVIVSPPVTKVAIKGERI